MGENTEKVGKSMVDAVEDVEEEDFTKSVNDGGSKSPMTHTQGNNSKDPYGQSTRSEFNDKSGISTFSNKDKDKSIYSHKSQRKLY